MKTEVLVADLTNALARNEVELDAARRRLEESRLRILENDARIARLTKRLAEVEEELAKAQAAYSDVWGRHD